MSDEEIAIFQYHPLRTDQGEIRLIRLTTSDNSEITCQVEHFPLKQSPHYTALSYIWGNSLRTQPITMNRQRLTVTRSLETFFLEAVSRRKRASDFREWTEGWIWIDAVCINQDDLGERSEQVSRMKEIYEEARNIVIWLGEASDGSDRAMELLEQIATLDEEDPSLMDGDLPKASCRFGSPECFIEVTLDDWAAVSKLMNRPYWDRSWILQEASTPKGSESEAEITKASWVCCGGKTLSWKTSSEANKRILRASWKSESHQYVNLNDVANTNIATIDFIEERRNTRAFYNPLYSMLVRSRTYEATDPRDKLYSILALTNERDQKDLTPDYTLTVEAVYTNLARVLITQHQCLDFLGSAGLVRDHGVPSWVPDWTVQHDRTPQPFYQIDQNWSDDDEINSQGDVYGSSAGTMPNIAFEKAGKQLVVHGLVFDDVKEVSMPRRWPDEDAEEVWQNWTSISKPDASPYVGGGSRLHAFEKVLKADINDVWGDWSAERDGRIEDFAGPEINAFTLHDGILDAMTWCRRLVVSSKGFMGIVSDTTAPGDIICILFGSQMPVVLREEGDHWVFVGQAYVHGIMDGEAVGQIDVGTQSRVFVIE